MSTSRENRFSRFYSLCCSAHISSILYVVGGALSLFAPRFVGAGAFSTMRFGNTSLVLEFACLIAVLVFHPVPQRNKTPSEIDGANSNTIFRTLEMTPFLFTFTCLLFIFFECTAFITAINNGYDPAKSWLCSPAYHIEQALTAALLMAYCLSLVSRGHHPSPNKEIQAGGIQNLRTKGICGAALFLAGVCLTGLPLLSAYTPFGSLSEPTVSYVFAVTATLIIALLASSLLWHCDASSTVEFYLPSFLCGSILINLGHRGITTSFSQSFNLPVCLAAITAIAAILTLVACLWSIGVGIGSSPDSEIASTPAGPLFEAPYDRLSDRERQVLLLSAKGHAVHSIAHELGIAPTTISTYKSRISKKLQLNWQEVVERSGIVEESSESKATKPNDSHSAQHNAMGHPLASSIVSLVAGLFFTLLLNAPQPTPTCAELLCIAGVLFLLTFTFLKESSSEPSFGSNLLTRPLFASAVSALLSCAVFHIPDGRMDSFSFGKHLLLFLLAWCVITALDRFLTKNASQAAKTKALDSNRARSYLDSKGIQGVYLEVSIATLNDMPASEIGRNLCISTSTVTSYRARIYAKLHVCGKEGLFQLLRSELS